MSRQKITENVLAEFNLYSTESGTIAFPVLDGEGNFVFNKYRRSPENDKGPKYTYDFGGKMTLYGWFKAKDHDTILITEGEKDCLVAWSHNIPAVTSTGGAMSFPLEWVDVLQGKNIILCFDNDKAGGQGMAKVAKMFGLENVKILFLPERSGIKDISDYVLNGGDLHTLIKTAKVIKDILSDRGDRVSLWQSTYFHDEFLKEDKPVEQKIGKRKHSDDVLLSAKSFPIPHLEGIKFNKTGKAVCPFHNEKTGSLQYYPKTNTCYCFGQCGKNYDVIDMYMKINDASFTEAINKLKE